MCQDRTRKLTPIGEPLAQSLPKLNVRRLTWEHGPSPMLGDPQTGG